LVFKTSKIINDMAKKSIKSENVAPFGGIFHVRELFFTFRGAGYRQSAGFAINSFNSRNPLLKKEVMR